MIAPQTPVHLETNGFVLRSLTPADVTARFVEWLNDKEMLAGLNLSHLNFTLDQLKAFVGSFNNLRNYIIGIFDHETNLLVGFYTLDVGLAHKVANITTGIGEKAYQGKGVLALTIEALLQHLYAYRDIAKVSARVLSKNRRILFNFMNAKNFVFEARLRQECLLASGERVDVLIFASYKTDFNKG